MTTSKKDHLSQTHITMFASDVSDAGQTYIVYHAGYYRSEGLKVTCLDPHGTGYADLTTAFLGGAYQFFVEVTSTGIVSEQSGGRMKAIEMMDIGQRIEFIIRDDFATAHGISNVGTTPAQSLAQFESLKGTHIKLAVSGISTGAGLDVLAACKLHNLTCGLNQPNDVVGLIAAGSTTGALAAVLAGKCDALGSVPPTTARPGTVRIDMGNISPISSSAGFELVTTPAEIGAHSDTVRAVVDATVKAWAYAKKSPSTAIHQVDRMLAEFGVTSPAEDVASSS